MIPRKKGRAMPASKAITVDLGTQRASLRRHLKTGRYDDASDVLQNALRALDREEDSLEAMLREEVRAAMADKRPSVPANLVFERLEERHLRRMRATKRTRPSCAFF